MKICHELSEIDIQSDTAVTIGKFDGFHLGHRALLKEILSKKKEGLIPVVLMLTGTREEEIDTEEESAEFLSQEGVEYFIRLKLTETLRNTSAEGFVRELLLEKLRMKYVACGSDFRFGINASGCASDLLFYAEKYGFQASVLEKVRMNGQEVSSTAVRDFLRRGEMEKANLFLGRPYEIRGSVLHGKALGRTLGFPTLNLQPPEQKTVPGYGVYYGICRVGGEMYGAVANIGTEPTVKNDQRVLLEIHLLGVDKDLYGEEAKLSFLHFIRPERKFSNVEELKKQVNLDRETAWKMWNGSGDREGDFTKNSVDKPER